MHPSTTAIITAAEYTNGIFLQIHMFRFFMDLCVHWNVSLQCRRILGERNLVRVRSVVVAAIFDFMTVEDCALKENACTAGYWNACHEYYYFASLGIFMHHLITDTGCRG